MGGEREREMGAPRVVFPVGKRRSSAILFCFAFFLLCSRIIPIISFIEFLSLVLSNVFVFFFCFLLALAFRDVKYR